MQDLKVTYKYNGETCHAEFENVFDLPDSVKENENTLPLDGTEVHATFFENPLLDKDFDTVLDLVRHCESICK